MSKTKEDFKKDYSSLIEKLGYTMAVGRLKDSIEARIQPLEGSPDPIPEDLLDRIRNEILPKDYKGLPVNVQYLGILTPRD